MTPLAEKLAARIRANGPITVADYMAAQVAALLPAEYRGCYGAEQAA